jgi:hypothetical protein
LIIEEYASKSKTTPVPPPQELLDIEILSNLPSSDGKRKTLRRLNDEL